MEQSDAMGETMNDDEDCIIIFLYQSDDVVFTECDEWLNYKVWYLVLIYNNNESGGISWKFVILWLTQDIS